MRRALFLIIVGLGGTAILLSLGIWQVQRLAWKQSVIADIETRITADPVALPQNPDPERDAYLPVIVEGVIAASGLRVLVSQKESGAGYRIITTMSTDDGMILLDHGVRPVEAPERSNTRGPARRTVIGNLQWPQEIDGFTPAPDLENNIWFARDVPAMAQALGTKPILVVVREPFEGDLGIEPMPVDTSQIPNNHLQYAVTWFSLAAIWLAMSLYFVRRRSTSAPASES